MTDGIVLIKLSREALEDAYNGCTQLAEFLPGVLRRINFEGQGKQDAKECKAHLLTAASACLTLINVIDSAPGGGQAWATN